MCYRNFFAFDSGIPVAPTDPNSDLAGVPVATLIRFKLCDDRGKILPGESLEMPRPGESLDDCLRRLRLEFGGRLMELHVEPMDRERSEQTA
jgi:hypothetical protein